MAKVIGQMNDKIVAGFIAQSKEESKREKEKLGMARNRAITNLLKDCDRLVRGEKIQDESFGLEGESIPDDLFDRAMKALDRLGTSHERHRKINPCRERVKEARRLKRLGKEGFGLILKSARCPRHAQHEIIFKALRERDHKCEDNLELCIGRLMKNKISLQEIKGIGPKIAEKIVTAMTK